MSKVVLITGASRGIGFDTASLFHEKGYTVYGTSRTPDKHNTPFELVELDVTDADSVKKCVNTVKEKAGNIDILINNAGVVTVGGVEDCAIEDYYSQFETNFFGIHRMIEQVLPLMKAQGSGHIINMGSFGGRFAIPYQSAYSSAKAALAVYTEALRMEQMRFNIKVSLIEPGDISTGVPPLRRYAARHDREKNVIAERSLAIMRQMEEDGTSSKRVAKRMFKIANKKNPKPRFLIGIDAIVFGFLQRLLPFRIQNFLAMLVYKVPRKVKKD